MEMRHLLVVLVFSAALAGMALAEGGDDAGAASADSVEDSQRGTGSAVTGARARTGAASSDEAAPSDPTPEEERNAIDLDTRARTVRRIVEANGRNEREIDVRGFRMDGRQLGCAENETFGTRVRCRVETSLRTAGTARLESVPEQCLVKDSNESIGECLSLHKRLLECRSLGDAANRDVCERRLAGLERGARVIAAECRQMAEENESESCLGEARRNALRLAGFRLQRLVDAAEGLVAKGVGRETVISFVEKMERYQLMLEDATGAQEGQSILRHALADWNEFKQAARKELRQAQDAGADTEG